MGSELLVGPKGNCISHWFHWSCTSLPLEALPHHHTYTAAVLSSSTALCPGFENWETETDPNANSHSHKVKIITRNTKTLEHVNKPQQMKTPSPQWKLNLVMCWACSLPFQDRGSKTSMTDLDQTHSTMISNLPLKQALRFFSQPRELSWIMFLLQDGMLCFPIKHLLCLDSDQLAKSTETFACPELWL